MKIFLRIMLAVIVVSVLAACGSGSENDAGDGDSSADNKDVTITFGVTPWTSTVPPTEIAKLIIEDMGYKVDEKSADAGSVYTGLSRGDINVFMDSWLPAHEPYLEEYSDSIENVAVSYDDADAGWVVPTYMEDINTVSDFIGNEDSFENEMYSIETGATAVDKINEMIEHYDLDIEQVNSSEGAMLAMAMKKIDKEEPVVFYGWRPHSMFNTFDIKLIEDDQGFFGGEDFETAYVSVIVNNELKEEAADVYEFLTNWSIPIEDVEEMIAQIENDEAPEDVAQEWIDNNEDQINKMLGM